MKKNEILEVAEKFARCSNMKVITDYWKVPDDEQIPLIRLISNDEPYSENYEAEIQITLNKHSQYVVYINDFYQETTFDSLEILEHELLKLRQYSRTPCPEQELSELKEKLEKLFFGEVHHEKVYQ